MIVQLKDHKRLKEDYQYYLERSELAVRIIELSTMFVDIKYAAKRCGFEGISKKESREEILDGLIELSEYYMLRIEYIRSRLMNIKPKMKPTILKY